MVIWFDPRTTVPGYDAVAWALHAARTKAEHVGVLLSPKDLHAALHNMDNGSLMLNVVLPIGGMVPDCEVVLTCDPDDVVDAPAFAGLSEFVASDPDWPLVAPGVWDWEMKDYVTITLREASHWPARNSSLSSWLVVARRLHDMGLRVIVVRDTEKAAEPLMGWTISPEASLDAMKRADLYAGARLNLGSNGGPMWLSVALGCPTVVAGMVCDNAGEYCKPAGFERQGFPVGSQFKSPSVKLIWEGQDPDEIMEAAEAML